MSMYGTEPDTLGRLRFPGDFDDDREDSVCDEPQCGEPVRITIQGLGAFCSREHADRASLRHEAAMMRRSG
jgi:2'-5' RNA ligase